MQHFSFRRKQPGACLVHTVLAVVAAAAFSVPVLAQNAHPQHSTAERMALAANRFIETLDADQRAMAVLPFDDEERYNFHFVPRARNGLPLKQMAQPQRIAAHNLLRSALSSQGYLKATSVIQLERVLEILERSAHRDRELYFVTVFGEPGGDAPWGWRFEGHHLSLNYTSVTGVTVTTPTFFGANPAEVRSGPGAGLRVLAAEEDLGRQLIRMLPSDRRERAIIASIAPDEIITGADREARLERFEGLPVADMTAAERSLLQRLILEYLHNMPEDIAEKSLPGSRRPSTPCGSPGPARWNPARAIIIAFTARRCFSNTTMCRTEPTMCTAYGGTSKTISGGISCGGITKNTPTTDPSPHPHLQISSPPDHTVSSADTLIQRIASRQGVSPQCTSSYETCL